MSQKMPILILTNQEEKNKARTVLGLSRRVYYKIVHIYIHIIIIICIYNYSFIDSFIYLFIDLFI